MVQSEVGYATHVSTKPCRGEGVSNKHARPGQSACLLLLVVVQEGLVGLVDL